MIRYATSRFANLSSPAQFGAANVARWRTVPISPLMIAGSNVIDLLAALINR